ncbi:TetR family transcriptional regulator C-terminal domain-containing protein [Pseudonocardia sp. MH-G8]|uniref:TetR family transcriptional regulator C-terminal domain-containing protein n=1 Tax=Pseudonocardia sp. MH-G8 TaxID=1854588 RepID=UPI000BA0A5F3|nr:TetR family transcriptional regulator C-terminal domain-containing protein [Pseudonocardia sp. MH-G8]OZM82120.1 hypothetical protein CFP66_09945 [Pseudonocardia sp. MH-G8]
MVRETLAEMLPLGPESRTGLLVHVAYLARAVHDPRLRAITVDGLRPLRDLLAEMLRRAAGAGQLATGRDPDSEAMTLICLAEGVSNHVLLETLTPAEGHRLVETHLAGLFATSGRCRGGIPAEWQAKTTSGARSQGRAAIRPVRSCPPDASWGATTTNGLAGSSSRGL